MKTRKLVSVLCQLGATLALSIGAASATPTGTPVLYSPFTQFNDQNLDFVIDSGAGNTGTIGVGDRLLSIFQFSQTLGIPTGGPSALGADSGNANTTLVGVADVTVVGIGPNGTLIFAPTNSTATPGTGLLGSFATGTAIAVYLNSTLDTVSGVNDILNSNCGTRAQCLADATDGSVYLTAGFFGNPFELWTSLPQNSGADIATVQGGAASTNFGNFNFALSVGINNTGVGLAPTVDCSAFFGTGCVQQVVGNGNIFGGQGLNPADWTARSKTSAQIAPIPEPGTIALFGIALAGLGVLRRRKN